MCLQTCVLDEYTIGECCDSPVIETCPDNSYCTSTACKGQLLDIQNNWVPFAENTLWTSCKVAGIDSLPGVCCKDEEKQPDIITEPLPPVRNQCGVRSSDFVDNYVRSNSESLSTRILGNLNPGYNSDSLEAPFGAYPWQTIIFFRNYTYICGGALIADQFVLTTAHKIHQFSPYDFRVRVGEWKVSSFDEPRPHADIDVSDIMIHPDFNPKNLKFNYALILLASPIPLEYHIGTICLPPPNFEYPPNTRCFATGWGKDSFGGKKFLIFTETMIKLRDIFF